MFSTLFETRVHHEHADVSPSKRAGRAQNLVSLLESNFEMSKSRGLRIGRFALEAQARRASEALHPARFNP